MNFLGGGELEAFYRNRSIFLTPPFDQQSSDPRTSGAFSWILRPSERGRGNSRSSLVIRKAPEPLPPTARQRTWHRPITQLPVLDCVPRGSKEAGATRWRLPISCNSTFSSLKRPTAWATRFLARDNVRVASAAFFPEGHPCTLPESTSFTNTLMSHHSEHSNRDLSAHMSTQQGA